MKKIFYVVLAATMCTAAIVTTSCKSNSLEIPTQQEIETKIIGKWKRVATDGADELTNLREICTYQAGGKAIFSQSIIRHNAWVWENRVEGNYSIEGNIFYDKRPHIELKSKINSINDNSMDKYMLSRTPKESGKAMEINSLHKYAKVNVDYSKDIIGLWEGVEITGYETYGNADARIEYKADGTYIYYKKVNDAWEELPQDIEEWNVDGDWLATRWQKAGSAEVNYEWWDIESISGETMKWSALREKEDGSRFNTTFTWKKIR